MRGGYLGNVELQKRLERAHTDVRPILEVLRTVAEDTVDTQAEWLAEDSSTAGVFTEASDPSTGLLALANGGMRISGAVNVLGESVTEDSPTEFDIVGSKMAGPLGDSIGVAAIEWQFAESESTEIFTVSAKLDPRYDNGSAQEVTTWRCQLFRLARVRGTEGSWLLQPISQPVDALAGSASAVVDFDFNRGEPVVIGKAPEIDDATQRLIDDGQIEHDLYRPVTVVVIWSLKGEGEAAGNTAWLCDSTVSQLSTGNGVIRQYTSGALSVQGEESRGSAYAVPTQVEATPHVSVKGRTYTQQVAVYTVDLGSVPTNTVEFILEGDQPGDTALTYEVNDDAGTSWVAVNDGDTTDDLAGVGKRQTYELRVTLDPSSNTQTSPIARRLGVREKVGETHDAKVKFGDPEWWVDPLTMEARIPEVELELLRDGNVDYRDFASELLSENYIGQIDLRIWIGHPDLARRHWLHHSDYIIEDVESAGPGVTLTCVSPLTKILRTIPRADTGSSEREALTYSNQNLKAVYDDLLDGQVSLPTRYVGPGVENTSRTTTRVLKTNLPAKRALEAVAFLDDGTVTESQGRLKYRPMFKDAPPVAGFRREEIDEVSVTPGYRSRITDFIVPFGWDDNKNAYAGDAYASVEDAKTNLGRALIDVREELPDDLAKWIEGSTVAQSVADRTVVNLAGGMVLWRFRTIRPHPHLEIGDHVAVQTDRFVARDPHVARALRGLLWAGTNGACVIVGVHNLMGTEFTVWVRRYSDILPSTSALNRRKYVVPQIIQHEASWSTAGALTMRYQVNQAGGSVRAADDAAAFPSPATIAAEAANAVSADGWVEVSLGGTWGVDTSVWTAALAYETSTGTGAEQPTPYQVKVTRPFNLPDGSVEVNDGKAAAEIVMQYNDLVTQVQLKRPGGSGTAFLKTYTVVGPGRQTFVFGTTTMDDGSTVVPVLTEGEETGEWSVDMSGGGETREIWRGTLRGPVSAWDVRYEGVTYTATQATIEDAEAFKDGSSSGQTLQYKDGGSAWVDAPTNPDDIVVSRPASTGSAKEVILAVKDSAKHRAQVTVTIEPRDTPRILSASLVVVDDGSDDEYTIGWDVSEAVTNADHNIHVFVGREGNVEAQDEEANPATITSMVITKMAAGDGVSNNHHATVQLTDGAATPDILDSVRVEQRSLT